MYAAHSNSYHVAMLLTFFSLNCFCFMLPLSSNSLPMCEWNGNGKYKNFQCQYLHKYTLNVFFFLKSSLERIKIVEINLQWKFFFLHTLVMCLLSLSTFHPSCISLLCQTQFNLQLTFLPFYFTFFLFIKHKLNFLNTHCVRYSS